MSRKSNRQIIEEIECSTRLRKQKRYANSKISGTSPVRKIHREDWRTIFESLFDGIDFALCKDGISQQEMHFIRKRIRLCEKVLPKFLDRRTSKYRKIVSEFQTILKTFD